MFDLYSFFISFVPPLFPFCPLFPPHSAPLPSYHLFICFFRAFSGGWDENEEKYFVLVIFECGLGALSKLEASCTISSYLYWLTSTWHNTKMLPWLIIFSGICFTLINNEMRGKESSIPSCWCNYCCLCNYFCICTSESCAEESEIRFFSIAFASSLPETTAKS